MSDYPYVEISRFMGLDSTRNKLSIPAFNVNGSMGVQLSLCQNFLFLSSGGLAKRGGGEKLSNAPTAATTVYGLSNYENSAGSQYLITVQGTKVYYYNSGWNDLGLALTSNKKMRFEGAGNGANRALYGVNENDSVVKIYMSGGLPTAAFVGSSPTTASYLRLHKNRLFAITGADTIGYTDVNAFDTWNTGSNYIYIAPGKDGPLKAIEIWGDALFLFKERGVYVLPNAAEATSEWKVLRADALTGTQSPDSVRQTKIGIMFLSTDNFVRLISPEISFSGGDYSLGGSGAPIVSHQIQEDFQEVLELNTKPHVAAISFNDLYILSFQTVNNGETYNDKTFFADTSKLKQIANIAEPQPYWGDFTNFNFDFYTTQSSSTEHRLYGAKGAIDGSVDGEIHETLNPAINNDDGEGIEAKAITAWFAPGGEGLYKKLKQVYFAGDTEDWYINLVFGNYKMGGILPGDGEGAQKIFSTTGVAGIGEVGSGTVGTSVVGQVGISSQRYRMNLKGHYFKVEFSNLNADEFIRINKLVAYYRPIHSR